MVTKSLEKLKRFARPEAFYILLFVSAHMLLYVSAVKVFKVCKSSVSPYKHL